MSRTKTWLWCLVLVEAVLVQVAAPAVSGQEAGYLEVSAHPQTVSTNGEAVRFSVDVVVPEADLPALITSLTSDVHGDIADPDNPSIISTECTVPAEYVPTGGWMGMACSFEALVGGEPRDVTVTISATVRLADASMVVLSDSVMVSVSSEFGGIRGTVVDAVTGLPIEGVYVWGTCTDCGSMTGPDGTFFFDGVEAGEYGLRSGSASVGGWVPEPPAGYRTEYAHEWYEEEPTGPIASPGSPVVVLAGEITEIRWELSLGGAIEGIVTDANTGAPVTEFQVLYWIVEADGTASPSDIGGYWTTGLPGDGSYRIHGLRAGDYIVCFEGVFPSTCWDGVPRTSTPPAGGDPVNVSLGVTTGGIDQEVLASPGDEVGDAGDRDGAVATLPFTGTSAPWLALAAGALVVAGAIAVRPSETTKAD